jgi:hypothetical protein
MILILETEFKPGDRVKHKAEEDIFYIVIGYAINNVDANGNVISYYIKCSAGSGEYYYLSPLEIEKAEQYTR